MNRYLLFGSTQQLAAGGIWDLINTFASIDEAVLVTSQGVKTLENNYKEHVPLCWWHVVDSKDKLIVAASETQPFMPWDVDSSELPLGIL